MSALWLATALRAGGLTVVEQPGWSTRGTLNIFTPLGVLCHHTAGSVSGDLPSLAVVRDGRTGLAGPLSQLMLSRSGVFHCIAAGRANHAGLGSASFVPNDDGNRYLIGIEAESTGLSDDWTTAQKEAYPAGAAALCQYMKVTERNVIGHKEWAPDRKIDPAFWSMTAFRATVAQHLGVGMALSAEDKQWMLNNFEKKGDLGYVREQILTRLGFDPATPPIPVDTELEPARRVDVGFAMTNVLDKLAVIEALVRTHNGTL